MWIVKPRATHLLQAARSADSVRQLLGQESIRTTANVYERGGDPDATAGTPRHDMSPDASCTTQAADGYSSAKHLTRAAGQRLTFPIWRKSVPASVPCGFFLPCGVFFAGLREATLTTAVARRYPLEKRRARR